jgi:hypothetical protein
MDQQRYTLELPNGETITATVTPEVLEITARVMAAMDAGRHPDAFDLIRLMAWADTDD